MRLFRRKVLVVSYQYLNSEDVDVLEKTTRLPIVVDSSLARGFEVKEVE